MTFRPPRLAAGLLAAGLLAAGCGGAPPEPSFSRVKVSPDSVSLLPAQGQRLAATALRTDLTWVPVDGQVDWASSDPGVATVDAAGLVQAVAVGSATVTARLPGGGPAGAATVEVRPPGYVSMRITTAAATLAAGRTVQLAAEGTLETGEVVALGGDVAWSSSAPGVATVSPSGLVRAVAPGGATIRAAFAAAGLESTAQVDVTSAVLESIAVSPPSPQLARGLALQLEASGVFSDGSTAPLAGEVAWSSSAPDRASIGATGRLEGIAPGTATVWAAHAASGLTGAALVTVTGAALDHLVLAPAAVSVPKGLSQQLAPTGVAADGTAGLLPESELAWTTSVPAVASVDGAGRVTGVERGSAEVTVRHVPSGLSATVPATVGPAVVRSITVSSSSATLRLCIGGNYTPSLVAEALMSDGHLVAKGGLIATPTVDGDAWQEAWSTTPPGLAAVAPNVLNVSGLQAGQGRLVATDVATGISGSCALVVEENHPVGLKVEAYTPALQVGWETDLSVTYRYLCPGGSIFLQFHGTFTSSDPSVATVDAAGRVRGLAPGTAVVTAVQDVTGLSGSTTVTVAP